MKYINVNKGIHLWRMNDLSNCMYFLIQGEASLFAENGYSFHKYASGDHFGESEMLMSLTRSTNLEAK